MKKSLILVCILFLFASCSMAPLNTSNSGRSLGKDQNQLKLTASPLGALYERGITNNLDLGLGMESQIGFVFSGHAKYSFTGHKNGFGFALLAGGGYEKAFARTKSAFLGPVFSYRTNAVEFFTTIRGVYIDWDFTKVSESERNDVIDIFFDKFARQYGTYVQTDVGVTFIGEKIDLTVGAKFLTKDSTAVLPMIDVGLKF